MVLCVCYMHNYVLAQSSREITLHQYLPSKNNGPVIKMRKLGVSNLYSCITVWWNVSQLLEQWCLTLKRRSWSLLGAKRVCLQPFCVLYWSAVLVMRTSATQKVNWSHSGSPLIPSLSIKSKKKQLAVTRCWTRTYVTHWFALFNKLHWLKSPVDYLNRGAEEEKKKWGESCKCKATLCSLLPALMVLFT